MKRIILSLCACLLITAPVAAAQESYAIQQLSETFFAALAKPGGRSSTNAFFFVSGNQVIAGGAHMTREAIDDLWSAIDATVHKPVRYFVLTHHHPGFSYIDTAFPADVTLVLSGETWKALDKDVRKLSTPLLLFSDGLTFRSAQAPSLVLSSIGAAHTDGDTIVIIPEEKLAYVGDLLYVKSVGYMGDGHMRAWLQSLDFLSELELKQIIPGYGPPVGREEVIEFRLYFRDFLSEVLTRIEAKESAASIKKNFTLPKYQEWSGYKQFLRDNAEHAWHDLQNDFSGEEVKN
jgi:glyoxylase-like metal-dependent hydrolase (beta-lactamase superfamily II)